MFHFSRIIMLMVMICTWRHLLLLSRNLMYFIGTISGKGLVEWVQKIYDCFGLESVLKMYLMLITWETGIELFVLIRDFLLNKHELLSYTAIKKKFFIIQNILFTYVNSKHDCFFLVLSHIIKVSLI